MPVLRAALGAIGLVALILAAWMVYLRAPVPVVFWLCVIGAVLVFAALFERVTYRSSPRASRRPISRRAPSDSSIPRPESSCRSVKPATGERVYVDLGAPPDRNHSS
jgi:hypothetical protein